MSLLWRKKKPEARHKKIKKRPSPKHAVRPVRAIEGTSLPAPRGGRLFLEAAMTVEAAVVLPLLLLFFLNLGGAIEMLRLHGNLTVALCQIGSKLTVYGYALADQEVLEGSREAPESGIASRLADMALSYTYVRRELLEAVGEEYLNGSPIRGGARGLQFWESEIVHNDDTVDISVTYAVAPFSEFLGFFPFGMANRYYGHLWTGYRITGEPEDREIVYVTEYGEVYHENRSCTHLTLTVNQTTLAQALGSRNIWGGRYTACEKCVSVPGETVYIAPEGDRYHNRRDCSGLTRTVYTMERGEAREKYRPCSRCAR